MALFLKRTYEKIVTSKGQKVEDGTLSGQKFPKVSESLSTSLRPPGVVNWLMKVSVSIIVLGLSVSTPSGQLANEGLGIHHCSGSFSFNPKRSTG